MKIVYDDQKRLMNIEKHGLDFADLDLEFFRDSVVVEAKERRLKAVGRFHDGSIAVVFASLGTEAISIISMRPASRNERSLLS